MKPALSARPESHRWPCRRSSVARCSLRGAEPRARALPRGGRCRNLTRRHSRLCSARASTARAGCPAAAPGPRETRCPGLRNLLGLAAAVAAAAVLLTCGRAVAPPRSPVAVSVSLWRAASPDAPSDGRRPRGWLPKIESAPMQAELRRQLLHEATRAPLAASGLRAAGRLQYVAALPSAPAPRKGEPFARPHASRAHAGSSLAAAV